jgi:hypothetical protein
MPPTNDSLDIARASVPSGSVPRKKVIGNEACYNPPSLKIVGMLDPNEDSFHDLLFSGSKDGLSSSSSVADHSMAHECLMANYEHLKG